MTRDGIEFPGVEGRRGRVPVAAKNGSERTQKGLFKDAIGRGDSSEPRDAGRLHGVRGVSSAGGVCSGGLCAGFGWHQPGVQETEVSRSPDDDVIQDVQSEQLGSGDHSAGEQNVVWAGLGLSAGVVVDQDEGTGWLCEDSPEDLGCLHVAAAQAPLRDRQIGHQSVAAVQGQDAEHLPLKISKLAGEGREHVPAGADGGAERHGS